MSYLKILILILSCFSITIFTTETAFACGCGYSERTINEELNDFDALFIGKVDKIFRPDSVSTEHKNADGSTTVSVSSPAPATAFLTIEKSFKGVSTKQIDFKFSSGDSCAYPFVENEKYLVFARLEKGKLVTDKCTGTRPVSKAIEDIETLERINETESLPNLLTAREQIAQREEWLKTRLDTMLLPMMRKHKIGMWIIVNEEFHHDPLTEYIAPPVNYVGRREFFIFVDKGTDELERIAIVGYPEEQLKKFFQLPSVSGKDLTGFLKKLVAERNPQTIALNFGGNRGATDGITHDTYKFLADNLGDDYSKRFVSAAPLITEYLDTRLPAELKYYRTAVAVTDILTRRALSNEVIKPGKTTAGDVRWWLVQQVKNLGLDLWFIPDIRIQRQGKSGDRMQHMFTLAGDAEIIERGDLIHVDYGLNYMGLSTDWQRHAYILKKGEKDAPAGLKAALKNTNTIQEIIMQSARPGMGGAEVYAKAMAEAKRLGIETLIYSHSIGNQGHALGVGIAPGKFNGTDAERLREGSYLSLELNATTPIPEWNNQKATLMQEDNAYLTKDGYQLFRPRQTELYIVR